MENFVRRSFLGRGRELDLPDEFEVLLQFESFTFGRLPELKVCTCDLVGIPGSSAGIGGV